MLSVKCQACVCFFLICFQSITFIYFRLLNVIPNVIHCVSKIGWKSCNLHQEFDLWTVPWQLHKMLSNGHYGSFNNYEDIILPPCTPCVVSFYTLSVDKNKHFSPPPPHLAHLVIEWPLTSATKQTKIFILHHEHSYKSAWLPE